MKKSLAIILTLISVLQISLLLQNGRVRLFLKEPLSAIGNMPGVYNLFLYGTSMVVIIASILIYSLFKEENIKHRWGIFALPVLSIVTLLLPYNKELILSRIIHTTLGIVSGLILVSLMWLFNKHNQIENQTIKEIVNKLPHVALIGTLTLFFLSGLNVLMELFYTGIGLFWFNLVSFSKKSKTSE